MFIRKAKILILTVASLIVVVKSAGKMYFISWNENTVFYSIHRIDFGSIVNLLNFNDCTKF